MKLKLISAAVLSSAVLMLVSCASTVKATSVGSNSNVRKAVESGEFCTPENGTLLYTFDDGIDFVYLQQNPEFGYKFYSGTTKNVNSITFLPTALEIGKPYCLPPMPVGSQLCLYSDLIYQTMYVMYSNGTSGYKRVKVQEYNGVGGVRFTLDKPGLMFASKEMNVAKRNKQELIALKQIRGSFKKTPWFDLIEARIQELKNYE